MNAPQPKAVAQGKIFFLPFMGWLTFLSGQRPPTQMGPTRPHIHLPGYQHTQEESKQEQQGMGSKGK
jgi:hypothetical protein